jgi:hypothetical protein
MRTFKEEIAATNVTDPQQLSNLYYYLNPNGHWFDRDTMRFFKTRISDRHIKTVDKVVYFIASNRFNTRTPRTYKLQSMSLATGNVDNLSPTEGETRGTAINRFNSIN